MPPTADPSPDPSPLPSAIPGRPLLPVRPWRPEVTLTALAAALASAVGAGSGHAMALVGVGALCVGAVVVGWVRLLDLPSPRGSTAVLGVSAVGLVATGWLAALPERGVADLRWVLAALGLSILAAFVHQLARRDGRPRLVESLTANVAGILIIATWASATPYLAHAVAPSAILIVACAVAIATLADLARGRWIDDVPAVVLAAGLAAAGAGLAARSVPVGGVPAWAVALAGVIAGVGSYALRQILFVQPTQSRRRPQFASGAASWLITGVVIAGLVVWQ